MKSRGKGLVILLAVIAAVAVYCFGFARQTPTVTLNGYLGGEKIGVLEDEDIKKIMASKYHIDMNYSKAGSLEMIDLDHTGMDYLFPSSRVAGDLYKRRRSGTRSRARSSSTPRSCSTRTKVSRKPLKSSTL